MTTPKALRIGGVMRCCVETLNTTQVREVAGEVLKCKYCSSSLIFRDGAWEWNREPNSVLGDASKA
jgi:uncharacterized protein (DUF1810 family)